MISYSIISGDCMLSAYQYVCPSICLSINMSVCPSVCLSAHLSTSPSVCLSINMPVCSSVYKPICLTVYQYACLPIRMLHFYAFSWLMLSAHMFLETILFSVARVSLSFCLSVTVKALVYLNTQHICCLEQSIFVCSSHNDDLDNIIYMLNVQIYILRPGAKVCFYHFLVRFSWTTHQNSLSKYLHIYNSLHNKTASESKYFGILFPVWLQNKVHLPPCEKFSMIASVKPVTYRAQARTFAT